MIVVEELVSRTEMLAQASERLNLAGFDQPRLEAIRLERDLLDRDTGAIPEAHSRLVDPAVLASFQTAVERRAAGEPLAYISGWAGFRHLDLRVDNRVLIPRPETESLVEIALDRVSTGVAADIGTGSGAIALSLVREGSFDRVIGCEISSLALQVAMDNAARLGLAVELREGSLLEPLRGTTVDLLISNPPYLTVDEYNQLDGSVLNWEPAQALIGGIDGMDCYRELLTSGAEVLNPGGWLALEVDTRRAATTSELATLCGWQDVLILDDLFGRARVLLARREN